jgi:predicted ATPase
MIGSPIGAASFRSANAKETRAGSGGCKGRTTDLGRSWLTADSANVIDSRLASAPVKPLKREGLSTVYVLSSRKNGLSVELNLKWGENMESFAVKGIKGFIDSGEIELKPLTLIFGQNSSGKSSILRFPLVLKQTFLDDSMAPLLFYGKSIDYGNFHDVVFQHNPEKPISFSLRLSVKELKRYFIMSRAGEPLLKKFKELIIEVEIAQDQTEMLIVTRFIVYGKPDNRVIFSLILSEDRQTYELKNFSGSIQRVKSSNMKFDKFIPDFRLTPDLRELREKVDYTFFYFFLDLNRYFNFIANRIFYIGPFRRTPERSYRYKENAVNYVGHDGEFAPVILAQDRRLGGTLTQRVSEWLKCHLNFSLEIEDLRGGVIDSKTDLFRIMITDHVTQAKNNIIDVGHGLSQLIPIVVQTFMGYSKLDKYPRLRSFPFNLTAIEQPELHLHPAAQSCLLDLFLAGIENNDNDSKKSFLIETHSEHMLIRLRRYIVEGKININDVAIYYTEKSSSGTNNVRRLEIDEFGNIENWPEGFFEEDFNEVLALRKALRNKNDGEDTIPW